MPRSNSKLSVDWRAYRAIGETCPTDDTLRPRAEYAYGGLAPVFTFVRSHESATLCYEAYEARAGYVAIVYRRAGRRWRATRTRGTYPTRGLAALAALAQRGD